MRYLTIAFAALALGACAGPDTPPDAWVFRPPPGQPSMIEAFEKEWSEDKVGTAHKTGGILGNLILLVLTAAAR